MGVTQVFGVVGDALNPFTDAIRRDKRICWIGVRHEEGAALAASGQAKLTGRLGVCAGTAGPGATHLPAGLYEADHDHAPVLAQHGFPIKVFIFNNSGWGLVHLEMEEAGLPVFSEGATFKNPDFAMFAEACGAHGFRVTQPALLRETVAQALARRGPVIVDVAVDPKEIPAMSNFKLEQAWKFGIGKARELIP